MKWLDKILGKEPTLDDLLAENIRLGREIDLLRQRRKELKALIDKHHAAREPKGLASGVIAQGD